VSALEQLRLDEIPALRRELEAARAERDEARRLYDEVLDQFDGVCRALDYAGIARKDDVGDDMPLGTRVQALAADRDAAVRRAEAAERDLSTLRHQFESLERNRDWYSAEASRLAAFVSERDVAIADTERRKNEAYAERDQVVVTLFRIGADLGWRVGWAPHEGESWGPEWARAFYVDLPTGQVSWHLPRERWTLVDWMPAYSGRWDGHSTEEKYRRLAALAPQKPALPPGAPGGPSREAHARVMALTDDEVAAGSVRAGIHTADGALTEAFADDDARTAIPRPAVIFPGSPYAVAVERAEQALVAAALAWAEADDEDDRVWFAWKNFEATLDESQAKSAVAVGRLKALKERAADCRRARGEDSRG
jgi:hypothetical protein